MPVITFFGIQNTSVLIRTEEHRICKEIGLDKWICFELVCSLWRNQQLPRLVFWPMSVRQIRWIWQKVEIIVLIYQVVRVEVIVRLEESCCPMTIDELPVAVNFDCIPTVIGWTSGNCDAGTVVDTFRPSS